MQEKNPSTRLSEIFGEAANALLFLTKNRTPQCWLITSALNGEGKTTVALGIASTMARRHKKVLLIDANFHNPTLSERFGYEAHGGLAEVLTQVRKLKDVLYREPEIENLFVLVTGNRDTEPFELFQGARMPAFLEKLKSLFDFIVIDSPALAKALDALLLVPHVAGCLMIVQAEKTGRSAVQKARQQIEDADGKVLGLIFNQEKKYLPKIFHGS